MTNKPPDDWAQVAEQGVSVFGQIPVATQIAIVVAVATVALAAITVWYLTRSRPGEESTVPAVLLLHVTEDFARQLAEVAAAAERLTEVVGEIRNTITGCQTCAWHPNAHKGKD